MMMIIMIIMMMIMTAASCGWRTHANVATDTDTALAAGDTKGGKGEAEIPSSITAEQKVSMIH